MMDNNINLYTGNLFNSKAQTLVNTVNCVGVMGKGIALEFKKRYPQMFAEYQIKCREKEIEIGRSWLWKNNNKLPWLLSFPTKVHWRYPSEVTYIEKGLSEFVASYQQWGITSIAFPVLGANNGGLNKEIIKPLMVRYLSKCNIPVEIWDFNNK
jgi:O-acetyl-ADP-ribose deacetylase (regulator of RNase III)